MKINTSAFINNHSNNIFSSIHLKKQNPLNKTLQNLIDNATDGIQKGQMLADNMQKEKLVKASLDTYTKTEPESGDLSVLSTETLKDLAALMKMADSNSNFYQNELQTYRKSLESFDSAIGKYEKMVNGIEAIPEGLTIESISEFLDKAKEAKNTYQETTNKHLQSQSKYYEGQIKTSIRLGSAISGEDYSDVKDMDLEFHADASNVYEEIDRISGHLSNIGGRVEKSLASIYEELEKRGEHTGYQVYQEQKHKMPQNAPRVFDITSIEDSLFKDENKAR